jgi:thiol-disulfide isomerase/thioredoxin
MSRLIPIFIFALVLGGHDTRISGQSAGGDVIAEVRRAIAAQDLARADAIVAQFRAVHGTTPEALAALSWLGRGSLAAKQFERADRYASETHKLAVAALATRKLDEDAHLQTALGAAIEVEALVGAAKGERSIAVAFLRNELEKYRDTAIHKRIVRNLNSLSLKGQPAPPLDATEYLGRRVPTFPELRGKVVLLFFWAHWCPDCKAESPIVAKLLDRYQPQGLTLIAPTQRFGYVAAGTPATPDNELRYITEIRDTHYGFLRNQPVPMSESNHKVYGVASTPTLVLVDRNGLVQLYHPGSITEAALDTEIRALLGTS